MCPDKLAVAIKNKMSNKNIKTNNKWKQAFIYSSTRCKEKKINK